MRRALVLGGGGPVGIAWELGVLAGLADEGVPPAWDLIVGTSAGSVVGAMVASGKPIAALYADHHALVLEEVGQPAAAADLSPLLDFMMRKVPDEPAPASLLREIGALASRAATIGEQDFIGLFTEAVSVSPWPESFVCTAVDVDSGEFRTWTRPDGVDLPRAVASSCAVPGLYPPITLQGRRYMDGGMRSAANGDLASGAGTVLMLAVTLPVFAAPMAAGPKRELADLEASGSRTALVLPDAGSHAAFGPSLMDATRRVAVLEAGFAQGRREAGRIGALID